MSFANDVKKELLELSVKKNCCKKAFLVGLIINAKKNGEGSLYAEFHTPDIAETTAALLRTLYNSKAEITPIKKPGRVYYRVDLSPRSLYELLDIIDKSSTVTTV